MYSRRNFIKNSGIIAAGALILPRLTYGTKINDVGIQLYSVRTDMLADATGTLKQLAKIGYKELESARSAKGQFYGLQPKEIKEIANDLGMTVRSGHVHIDENWMKSIEQAAEAGQTYLICSSMPSEGQTVDNYKRVAEIFNKAGEECSKANLIFGYHNHEYEFQKDNGKTLYDVLLDNTDSHHVKMEMDLGWVILSGEDPEAYFKKYPGRFPLFHLKDMDKVKKHSTEFGKGDIDLAGLLKSGKKNGMKYFFVEQEEYTKKPLESMEFDFQFLQNIK
jgi:sugar phosphate isomerase/epimerase